jgi:hypothetical protein
MSNGEAAIIPNPIACLILKRRIAARLCKHHFNIVLERHNTKRRSSRAMWYLVQFAYR